VTAFVGDVIEAVYCAVAEIRPYSTHGGGTMIHFHYLIRIGRYTYIIVIYQLSLVYNDGARPS